MLCKVICGLFLLVLVTLVSAEDNRRPYCNDTVVIEVQDTKRFKLDARRGRLVCPKGLNQCTPSEEMKLNNEIVFNPTTDLCCYKNVGPPRNETHSSCCNGWSYNKTLDLCQPLCRRIFCEGGYCVAPEECACDDSLVLFGRSVCLPPCVNAIRISKDTCECHSDHHSINNTHCARDCDSGYFNDEQTLQCTFRCDSDCVNSICSGPNYCTCNAGFKHLDDFSCIPKCDPDCSANSECVAPNECQCRPGYSKQNGSDVCTPVCAEPCVNSKCVSPDVCECFTGFKRTKDKYTCEPECAACKNGDCVAPKRCICHDGYTKSNDSMKGECLPVCAMGCENGYCSEPNICACKEGYKKNSTHSSVCFKSCAEPCPPGAMCSQDGVCECANGYKLINGSCKAATPVECSSCDAVCDAAGACRCGDAPCVSSASYEVAPAGMAGWQLTWTLFAAVALILVVLVMVVMQRIWARRRQLEDKAEQCEGTVHGSIVYQCTVPDSLLTRELPERPDDVEDSLMAAEQMT